MISRIYHLADIHLRLFKRHKEYEQVFKRLFQYIEETKDENSVIFLGGDIVHNKTDMSPELINICAKFLKRCADLLPTILITGNHDLNLNNSNRLDALTPIVNSLNHSNLHYWKNSGVYKLNGVSFSVFGISGDRDKWILGKDIKAKYKIALYHGQVAGCRTDLTVLESGISVEYFNDFDLGLLGDIHSKQFLNEEKTIAFAGSLIQQNHGENIDGHGLLVWDLKRRNAEFVPIKNDFGYYTFYILNGKCDIPENLPKNLRVRIKYENSTASEIENIIQRISKKYTILELVKQKSIISDASNLSKQNILGNSRNIDYQNKIIADYLKALGEISDIELEEVLTLNAETNKLLPIHNISRNVIWKPIKLEFSNMFSYGENNIVGFDNLKGIYGIFSKNTDGKSSIFDVLTFVIYDKTTRTNKGSHILNVNRESFYCKLQFNLNGTDYFIERIGTKYNSNGGIRVDVNFWYFDELGEKISLNGEDRDKTNYAIRNLLGTYDDFVMTALSTQYDNQNFVEKSQRDRKELLYKFLDIFIYDDLYRLAKENSKEYQVLIRELESDNLHEKSSQLYQIINNLEISLEEIDSNLDSIRTQTKEKTNVLLNLNKQYQPTKEVLNIDRIETTVISCNVELKKFIQELSIIKDTKVDLYQQSLLLDAELSTLSDYANFDSVDEEYRNIQTQLNGIKQNNQQIQNRIQYCKDKKSQLENHKYDPNCEFCINNEFVTDAKQSIQLLPELKLKSNSGELRYNFLQADFIVIEEKLEFSKRYQSIFRKKNQIEQEIILLSEKEISFKYKGRTIQEQLKDLKGKEKEYHKNSLIIEQNSQILSEIEVIKHDISNLEQTEIQQQLKHREKYSEIERKKKDYEVCIEKLNKYSDYIKKYRIYELYLQALSRDGVPYKIVEAILPVLENEVNIILNSIANFTVRLEATDEKYIHAYLVYGASNSWPVELSSGMERFILSLAFRVAMGEITSLPKANFLAIDEGFGVLDSDNIMQIGKLFQVLKSQYDYLICISHIDSMKDLVDNQISIDKIGGFSRLRYNDSI